MLRVVLAAVLASALVGTGFAALDTASRDRGNARVAASAERVTAAVADLRERAAPVPPDSPGARRVVTVRLPARDYATVPVEYFTIGGRPGEAPKGDAPAIAWQVEGSHERTRQVSGARVVGWIPGHRRGGWFSKRPVGTGWHSRWWSVTDGRRFSSGDSNAARTIIRESGASGGHVSTVRSVRRFGRRTRLRL